MVFALRKISCIFLGLRVEFAGALFLLTCAPLLLAQQPALPTQPAPEEEEPETPERIGVRPLAADEEIAERLARIMESTGWFTDAAVRVENGVVFLEGITPDEKHREWIEALSRRTEDVVAVVNRIELAEGPFWDFTPAIMEFRELRRETVRILPVLALGLLIFIFSWGAARLISRGSRLLMERRAGNPLLIEVFGRTVMIVVLIFGTYIALRVTGLTRLALTVAGGTGIAGIILGIAFRDIAENFLASLLISIQSPFRNDDLIEVEGQLGYVRKVTTRGTVLMAFDGNYIRIPNSTIYKSKIRNYSANPHYRQDFTVGIGFDTPIVHAQEVGLKVLQEHPAVLNDPEPMILVETLGAAAITLRVYFWIHMRTHSFLRVRSSVMRLMLRAFEEDGISLPDSEREVIFPQTVPIQIKTGGDGAAPKKIPPRESGQKKSTTAVSTCAEGDLETEAKELESQAKNSRAPEEGRDILAEPSPLRRTLF